MDRHKKLALNDPGRTMLLQDAFSAATSGAAKPLPKRRRAPFSLRLSEAERVRLADEARGAPLGAYIKAKVLGSALPVLAAGLRPDVVYQRFMYVVEDAQAEQRNAALLADYFLAHATERDTMRLEAPVPGVRHDPKPTIQIKPDNLAEQIDMAERALIAARLGL
jgi:hypothetical protein